MRTKEFIKRVEELGFYAEERGDEVYLYRYNSNCLAKISKKFKYTINTFYREFIDLNEENRSPLFDLIDEYISTPVNEREEPKKYYLRHRWMGHEKLKYLELDTQNDEWYLGHKYDTIFVTAKNEFTLKEIEEIKEKYNTDLSDFEIVEVEEWIVIQLG